MAINLSAGASKVFHYQMLPSAFQIAEAPTYAAWQIFRSAENLWNQEAANYQQLCVNRTFAILSGVGGYLGGIIALPITLACTPITAAADIIVGIAECSFCYYHGLSGNDIKKIAHRKFIVSPLQQFTFCLAAISAASALSSIFSLGRALSLSISNPYLAPFALSTLWTFGYSLGQVAVGKLPSHLNHRSFNIFINGGSGEEEGKKWLDDDEQIPPSESFPASDNSEEVWQKFIGEEMCNLSSVDDARTDAQYVAFKKGVFERKTPRELLNLNDSFSKNELNKSYKTLARILHPDRNGSSKEATSLFKILSEAYKSLI